MERNTVVLDIKKYDELKEKEKLVGESNYICRVGFTSYYSIKKDDVLEALKVNINLKPAEVEDSIKKFNFAFMFAPNYHSAMKHVGPARKKIGKKLFLT